MPINPITGLEEEDEYAKIFRQSDADRQKLVGEQGQYDTTGAIAGALASLGAGFQGKDSMAAVNQVMGQRRDARKEDLSALDKWKQGKIQEIQAKRDGVKAKREDEQYGRESGARQEEDDATSERSKIAQQIASKATGGKDFSSVSATRLKTMLPDLMKVYEIEQKKLDRQEARDERRFQHGVKANEKMQGLKTPFGLANTEDDAKNLKAGFESKSNFDSKIQEMIDLRKNLGTEYWDREAVARGKQLSKDLLLEYKNMAKLGVLSQADENIINAIIPADPLAQDWMPGQDSILSVLEKFKQDSDRDFKTKVATRTRSGVETAASAPPPVDPDAESAARQKRIAELRAKKSKSVAGKP